MTVKSLKKQLAAAIAMVLVATVALGSSTFAWFVSNNSVTATTTQIAAQSNSAYLVIDNKLTSSTSTNAAEAAEEVGADKDYEDNKLFPAQWAKNFDEGGGKGDPKIYQFESAYASTKDEPTEKENTRFVVGNPTAAVTADYALLNTFYVGTGKYDGEFTNLKVSDMTVTATEAESLRTAMRLLIMTYAPTDTDGNFASAPTAWAVVKYDGTEMVIESQSIDATGNESLKGVIYEDQFGKAEGDVKVEIYAYYDGSDAQVYTTNLEQLTLCGATATFEATAKEFK